MMPRAILKLCHVVGQPVSLTASGPCPGPWEPRAARVPGSSHLRWPPTSVSHQVLGLSRGPAALDLHGGGGCDVPSVHLSGCRPCHPDTCLTCLTRAMPVTSPPRGLCVGGLGAGPGSLGWAVGAWSWHRPQPQGTLRQAVAWTRGGSSHPIGAGAPQEAYRLPPEGLRMGGGGFQSVGHRGPQTEGQGREGLPGSQHFSS